MMRSALLILLLLPAAAVGQTYASLQETLVSHWKMDETSGLTLADSVGPNDCTLSNDASTTTAAALTSWSTASQDRQGDAGATSNTTGLAATAGGSESLTISFWFRATDSGESFFTCSAGNAFGAIFLDAGRVRARFRGSTAGSTFFDLTVGSVSEFNDDAPHHVVIALSDVELLIAVDGVILGTESGTFLGDYGFAASTLTFGTAWLDELKVYDQAHSSEAAIAALYVGPTSFNELMGLGSHSEDAALEGWWLLADDAATATVADQSSNGNDGAWSTGNSEDYFTATEPAGPWLAGSAGSGAIANLGTVWPLSTGDFTFLGRGRTAVSGGGNYLFKRRDVENSYFRFLSPARPQLVTNGDSFVNLTADSEVNHADDEWHSYGGIRRNGSTYLCYDGVEAKSGGSSGDMTDPSADWEVHEGWAGPIADVVLFSRGLWLSEFQQWEDGPEANYVSGFSFSADGAFDAGTWALPSPFDSASNGTITYEVWAVNAAGEVVDTAAAATGTLDISSEDGNLVYFYVRATCDGGFDTGDYDSGSRSTSFGASGDGRYELGNVTAGSVATQYLNTNKRLNGAVLTIEQ